LDNWYEQALGNDESIEKNEIKIEKVYPKIDVLDVPNAVDADRILLRHKDPRPDLTGDHKLWVALLTRCYKEDKDLWGVFHGFRCAGAKLEKHLKLGLKLLPGEIPQAQYKLDAKKYLKPRNDRVLAMFKAAGGDVFEVDDLAGKDGDVRNLTEDKARKMDRLFDESEKQERLQFGQPVR